MSATSDPTFAPTSQITVDQISPSASTFRFSGFCQTLYRQTRHHSLWWPKVDSCSPTCLPCSGFQGFRERRQLRRWQLVMAKGMIDRVVGLEFGSISSPPHQHLASLEVTFVWGFFVVCLFSRYIVLQVCKTQILTPDWTSLEEPWPRDAIGSQQTAAGPVGPRGDENTSAI